MNFDDEFYSNKVYPQSYLGARRAVRSSNDQMRPLFECHPWFDSLITVDFFGSDSQI